MMKLNLLKRKQNRLENYDYGQNGLYFITICTRNRKRILCDIGGDDAYIVPLRVKFQISFVQLKY